MKSTEQNIPVTKPSLPALSAFVPYLQEIWDSAWLTNCGQMHQRLERELAAFLGVPYVALFNNATSALMVALRALHIKGEVITTPYSFIATSHSLLWNGNQPVFVDIDPETLNIDPQKIEAAITENTAAIMPVHCYGTPCNVDAIAAIARKYGLQVIYDAAHAFAVDDAQGSILNHGDLSVLSFHATKVFNTFEGGAIVCQQASMKKTIDSLKNFGIQDEVTVTDVGMNGKMAEVNAAFGLLQLQSVRSAIARRKAIAECYRSELANVQGIRFVQNDVPAKLNYGYFPILVGDGFPITRDALYETLKANGILSRRYFYPLISSFPMYNTLPSAAPENLPVASCAAQQVLCLPIYDSLEINDAMRIIEIVKS